MHPPAWRSRSATIDTPEPPEPARVALGTALVTFPSFRFFLFCLRLHPLPPLRYHQCKQTAHDHRPPATTTTNRVMIFSRVAMAVGGLVVLLAGLVTGDGDGNLTVPEPWCGTDNDLDLVLLTPPGGTVRVNGRDLEADYAAMVSNPPRFWRAC